MRALAIAFATTIACGQSHGGGGGGGGDSGGATATILACGSTTCPATPYSPANGSNDSYCCLPQSNLAAPTCVHGNLGACESGNPWYCDQAADCNAGLVCCEQSARAGMFACLAPAACGMLQACRTSAECTNGQSCVTRTCGGTTIGTCGALTAQQAQLLDCT